MPSLIVNANGLPELKRAERSKVTARTRLFEDAPPVGSRIGSLIASLKLSVPMKSGSVACAIGAAADPQVDEPTGWKQTLLWPKKLPIEPRSLATPPSPNETRFSRPLLFVGSSRCSSIVPPRLAEAFCTKRPNGPIIAWKLRFVPAMLAVSVREVSFVGSMSCVLRKRLCCVPVSFEPSAVRGAGVPSEPSNVIVNVCVEPSYVTLTLPERPPSACSAVCAALWFVASLALLA